MNNWLDVKEKLPPNDLIVEIQCTDIWGRYWMEGKYVLYNHYSRRKKIGRWMYYDKTTGCWYAYNKQEEIESWRFKAEPTSS